MGRRHLLARFFMVAFLGLVAGTVAPVGGSVAATARPVDLGRLTPNASLFWQGDVADSLAGTAEASSCDLPTAECFQYSFEVTGPGDRLRVALSDATITEGFRLYLYDPAGNLAGTVAAVWSAELFTDNPARGMWRVLVVAEMAEDATFWVRAKLEQSDQSATAGPPRDLLPNLRLTPPFEVTLTAPTTLFGPGGQVLGQAPASCSAVEIAEKRPRRCLRFAVGPQNVGDGPLELRYRPSGTPVGTSPIRQVVHRTDGSTWTRDAGTAEYHHSHAHYHDVGFGSLEVFRVDDLQAGSIKKVGEGPKQGFCIAQYLIVDWNGFDQDPVARTSTCDGHRDTPAQESVMWLTRGWSDIYGWSLDGNYVELPPDAPDGLYLIRSTTDPANEVLETDEHDNTGYALVSIRGNAVELLERGHGDGPWDQSRVVLNDPRLYDEADTQWVPFNDAL